MNMVFGKYGPSKINPNGVDICFVNSGYLKWLIEQEWFFMNSKNEDLVVALEKELEYRENYDCHFYTDKVKSRE